MDLTHWKTILDWYGIDISKENIEILYLESHHDWSWGGVLIVFLKDNKYFINDDFDMWQPREISQDDALEEMLEFESMRAVLQNA